MEFILNLFFCIEFFFYADIFQLLNTWIHFLLSNMRLQSTIFLACFMRVYSLMQKSPQLSGCDLQSNSLFTEWSAHKIHNPPIWRQGCHVGQCQMLCTSPYQRPFVCCEYSICIWGTNFPSLVPKLKGNCDLFSN